MLLHLTRVNDVVCLFTLHSLNLQFKGNKIFVRNLGDRPFSGEILTSKERLSQIGIRDKKIIILINSRHFTMDFFFYFQGQDVQHKRSYISYIHRYSSRRVPSQNWSRVAGRRGLQISNQHHENDGKHTSPGTKLCKTRINVAIAKSI